MKTSGAPSGGTVENPPNPTDPGALEVHSHICSLETSLNSTVLTAQREEHKLDGKIAEKPVKLNKQKQ